MWKHVLDHGEILRGGGSHVADDGRLRGRQGRWVESVSVDGECTMLLQKSRGVHRLLLDVAGNTVHAFILSRIKRVLRSKRWTHHVVVRDVDVHDFVRRPRKCSTGCFGRGKSGPVSVIARAPSEL
jgi:hypothetical protein